MKVNVAELRIVANKLLDHLEATGHAEVGVDVDFYWEISSKQRYEPYVEPGPLSMGQLSDDWTELKRIAEGQALPVSYALVWLASILRRIGETSAG